MALFITFHNNMSQKINEFQKKYGSSRTFIAKRMGISRQSLNALETSENPTIQMLIKLSHVIQCEVTDLYSVKVMEQMEFDLGETEN